MINLPLVRYVSNVCFCCSNKTQCVREYWSNWICTLSQLLGLSSLCCNFQSSTERSQVDWNSAYTQMIYPKVTNEK